MIDIIGKRIDKLSENETKRRLYAIYFCLKFHPFKSFFSLNKLLNDIIKDEVNKNWRKNGRKKRI